MKPNQCVVLGTGGTIAGTANQASDNLGYSAAQRSVQALLEALGPTLPQRWELLAEQVAQIDSKDMDFAIWLALARRCQHHLQNPAVRGIVITHGTDTLEETAWFLHCVLQTNKPVVLTCAMRPATALFADGPQNLRDALAVVAHPQAQGVVVVCAGKIHGAQWVQKVHPYRLDAFDSGDAGPLAWVEEGRVRTSQPWPVNFLGEETTPVLSPSSWMDVADADAVGWPRVEVVMSYAGASATVVDALVACGVQGLVVAATGNGTIHQTLIPALKRAKAAGVAVLVATRCPWGQLVPSPETLPPWPCAVGLSPVKARISLMLQLLEGAATASKATKATKQNASQ